MRESERHYEDCSKGAGDTRIVGCSSVIDDRDESLRNRAMAYYYRGDAWRAKDDPDRAIADYSEVIRLNTANTTGMPKELDFSWVHLYRALSYEKIGKRDKVIEDLKFAAAHIEQKWWNDELKAKLAEYKLIP